MGLEIVLLVSIMLYSWAFGLFRKYLAVKNTPTSKVAALSPGMCEVHGKAEAESPILLPDGTECVAYKLRCGRKNSYIEEGLVPFYVRDETGRVLVDPSSAAEESFGLLAFKGKLFPIRKDQPEYEKMKKFLEERGVGGYATPGRRVFLRYIPTNESVYVIGDYLPGPLRKPSLSRSGSQPGFARYLRGMLPWGKINVLYPEEVPEGELPHIGRGQNGVFVISPTERASLVVLSWSVFFGFALAPIGIAVFVPAIAEAIVRNLGLTYSLESFPLIAASYLLLMAYPAYLYLSSFYNSLVILRNNSSKYLANIDAYLERRNAVIPQLEQVAKAYAKHEKSVLENAAGRAMGSKEFMAIAEEYPELKADDHYQKFSQSLSEAEEQIAQSCGLYNDSATLYNTRINTFPSILLKWAFGFESLKLIRLEE
jgi:LemA protein